MWMGVIGNSRVLSPAHHVVQSSPSQPLSSIRELLQTFKVFLSLHTSNSQTKNRFIPTWPPYCAPKWHRNRWYHFARTPRCGSDYLGFGLSSLLCDGWTACSLSEGYKHIFVSPLFCPISVGIKGSHREEYIAHMNITDAEKLDMLLLHFILMAKHSLRQMDFLLIYQSQIVGIWRLLQIFHFYGNPCRIILCIYYYFLRIKS